MADSLPSGAELRASLQKDGYVLLPNFFTPNEVETYKFAAQETTSLARNNKWPYIRTLPKQFPPWGTDASQGIWGVQHLLHPQQPHHKVFAQSYFHPKLIATITSLLQCSESDLVLELYNMLVRPDADFALRWHRDDIPPSVSPSEELQRLQEPMLHAQWNLALYPDASLVVVPGSHTRARTDMERSADPYEDEMPGQKIVRMNAGDILFYNNNILHRGVYDCRNERMTLHGTMGLVGADPARARNIMQHGIGAWAAEAEFGDLEGKGVAELAKGMQERLIRMGSTGEVEYSQAD